MKNLKAIRELKGLTRQQLAEKVGCSEDMVISLELGRTKGSIKTLLKLAEVLETTTDFILGR